MEKLNVKAMALALGTICGIYALLLGWIAIFDWGWDIVDIISTLYIGYGPSFFGGIIGGIWGFLDGAIAGAVIAWIYNKFIPTQPKI